MQRFQLMSYFSILAVFPALQAPPTTAFKCYSQLQPTSQGDDILLVGESSSIEFVSNEEESKKVADSGCLYVSLFFALNRYLRLSRYLLALRNKKTGTISIYPSPKSPSVLTHTVKALKKIPTLPAPSKLEYLEAKTALGQTFGTKKQKANIRARERNKIDTSAMEGIMDYVMDSIDKGVENLPTIGLSRSSLIIVRPYRGYRGESRICQQKSTYSRIFFRCYGSGRSVSSSQYNF